jgi:hypothetical protein
MDSGCASKPSAVDQGFRLSPKGFRLLPKGFRLQLRGFSQHLKGLRLHVRDFGWSSKAVGWSSLDFRRGAMSVRRGAVPARGSFPAAFHGASLERDFRILGRWSGQQGRRTALEILIEERLEIVRRDSERASRIDD